MTCALALALLLGVGAGCAEDSTSNDANQNNASANNASANNATANNADPNNADPNNADPNNADPNNAAQGCVPNERMWDTLVEGMVQDHCQKCHGEAPDFGAPYSLTDYDDLIAGTVGSRKVDRMVARMANKTMPPVGTAVPHADLDTMVGWASCGEAHPDHSIGLLVDRPVFEADAQAPEGMESFDLTADEFEITPETLNLYQCFTFDIPVGEERFLRRIEPLVDDSRVLHHIVLFHDTSKSTPLGARRCFNIPADNLFLYTWAPGTGPIAFDDGGLRMKPGDRYTIQIHYNNGAGAEDVRDSSGVRIYHDEPTGTEYGMFAPGPLTFQIPDGQETTIEGACEVDQPVTLVAGMPHMHEVGSEFHQIIQRADGTEETLISLTGWSFELQYFYELPVQLNPGDRLLTRCVFDNQTGQTVRSGENTEDEMCFNFIYTTPALPQSFCNKQIQGEFDYAPGACAPPQAAEGLEPLQGNAAIGEPEALTGGTWADGSWLLSDYTIYIPNPQIGANLDLDRSYVLAAGQAHIEGQRAWIDLQGQLFAVVAGAEYNQDFHISIAGDTVPAEAEGQRTLTYDCGAEGQQTFSYFLDDDTLILALNGNRDGFRTISLLTFEPAP
jgi:hypothetical protein